jgi:hypothetical protein
VSVSEITNAIDLAKSSINYYHMDTEIGITNHKKHGLAFSVFKKELESRNIHTKTEWNLLANIVCPGLSNVDTIVTAINPLINNF